MKIILIRSIKKENKNWNISVRPDNKNSCINYYYLEWPLNDLYFYLFINVGNLNDKYVLYSATFRTLRGELCIT